jgi:hypothetical protein
MRLSVSASRYGLPVHELLDWASEPLATAEVALIMQFDLEQARDALRAVARYQRAGADGYWTLDGRPA